MKMKTKMKATLAKFRGKKRLVGLLGAILLAISLATGSTFAWYMASDSVVNELRNRQVGDVVIAIDGRPVDSPSSVTGFVRERRAGDTISLTYVRAGVETTVSVILAVLDEPV